MQLPSSPLAVPADSSTAEPSLPDAEYLNGDVEYTETTQELRGYIDDVGAASSTLHDQLVSVSRQYFTPPEPEHPSVLVSKGAEPAVVTDTEVLEHPVSVDDTTVQAANPQPSPSHSQTSDDDLQPAELVLAAETAVYEALAEPSITIENQSSFSDLDVSPHCANSLRGAQHELLEATTEDSAEASIQLMGPPMTPARPQMRIDLSDDALTPLPDPQAITPRLLPLASPGLPLVSPLVKRPGVETGYFPSGGDVSELDAESRDHSVASFMEAGYVHEETPAQYEEEEPDAIAIFDGKDLVPATNPFQGTVQVTEDLEETQQLSVAPQRPRPIETATQPPAILPVSYVEVDNAVKSTDALAFMEEFLSMSPVSQNRSVPPKPVSGEKTVDPRLRKRTASPFRPSADTSNVPSNLAEEQPQATVEEADAPPAETPRRASPALVDGAHDLAQRRHEQLVSQIVSDQSRINQSGDTTEVVNEQITYKQKDTTNGDATSLEDAVISQAEKSEIAQPLLDQGYLPTPAATQQVEESQQSAIEALQTVGVSMRDDQSLQPHQAQSSAKVLTPETPTVFRSSKQNDKLIVPGSSTPATMRRASQRLSRKSEITVMIDSPFFSATKTATPLSPPQPALMNPEVMEDTVESSHVAPDSVPVHEESLNPDKLKTQKPKGVTTSLGYYPPLSSLQEYFGQVVDIIAICSKNTTKPAQAKGGPRDWHCTLRLVDSDNDESRSPAQIFRPYKSALPQAKQGDAIILRNFKVQTAKHEWTLLSTDESAWAVFESVAVNEKQSLDGDAHVQMAGPHLDYGDGEIDNVRRLVQWWHAKNTNGLTSNDTQGTAATAAEEQSSQSHTTPEYTSTILPTIEQPGPSSPRRSRRLQSAQPFEEASPEPPTKPVLNTTTTTSLAPTRQQPARRARTKTPTVSGPSQIESPVTKATPSIVIPSSSPTASAASPPTSPTYFRRRTRSTVSPNPSLVNSVAASSSHAPSLASPTAVTLSAAGSKSGKEKGGSKSKAQPKRILQQQDHDQAGNESGTLHATPAPTARRKTRATASPPLVHELRDGMRYVDAKVDGGAEEKGVVTAERRKGLRSEDVHELRDGVRYVDG